MSQWGPMTICDQGSGCRTVALRPHRVTAVGCSQAVEDPENATHGWCSHRIGRWSKSRAHVKASRSRPCYRDGYLMFTCDACGKPPNIPSCALTDLTDGPALSLCRAARSRSQAWQSPCANVQTWKTPNERHGYPSAPAAHDQYRSFLQRLDIPNATKSSSKTQCQSPNNQNTLHNRMVNPMESQPRPFSCMSSSPSRRRSARGRVRGSSASTASPSRAPTLSSPPSTARPS